MRETDPATLFIQLQTEEPLVLISGSYTVEQYLDPDSGQLYHITMSNSEAVRTFDREGALELPVADDRPFRVPEWLPNQLPEQQLINRRYPDRMAGGYFGNLMLVIRNQMTKRTFTLLLEQLFVVRTAEGPDRNWVIGGTNGLYREQAYYYQATTSQGGSIIATLAIKGQDRDQVHITNLAIDEGDEYRD